MYFFARSIPSAAAVVGSHQTGTTGYEVAVSGDYAFVADWTDFLTIFDISTPANPQEIGVFESEADGVKIRPTSVCVEGNTAFIGGIN